MPAVPVPSLFPMLADTNDFGDFCVDLLRLYWNRPKLERLAKRDHFGNFVR